MNWMLFTFAALLCVSMVIGHWRASRSDRAIMALFWQVPALILVLMVLALVKVVVEAHPGSDNLDLAIIATVLFGMLSAFMALVGGLTGAWIARR